MRVLAEHGIEIYNSNIKEGNNALHLCAKFKERFNILEMLVRSNYDLDLQNKNGDTATHIAAMKGNFKHIECLVQAGAQINTLNNHGLSPLYLAVLNHRVECSKYLLENGAKPFFAGSDLEKDRSPIFLAIRN